MNDAAVEARFKAIESDVTNIKTDTQKLKEEIKALPTIEDIKAVLREDREAKASPSSVLGEDLRTAIKEIRSITLESRIYDSVLGSVSLGSSGLRSLSA